MIVAVHISRSLHLYANAFNASFACLVAELCPEHQFILLYDDNVGLPDNKPSNCSLESLPTSATGKSRLWLLYRFILPRLLKKYKADIFITSGDICCFSSPVPQLVIFHDLEIQQTRFRSLLQRRRKKVAERAKWISSSTNLNTADFTDKETIQLHPGSEQITRKPEPTVYERIDEITADQTAYFLYVSASNDQEEYKRVLKAFGDFKKWQKSSMQLIIICNNEKFAGISSLSSYKYRQDVVFNRAGSNPAYAGLLQNAYAVISLTGYTAARSGIECLNKGIPFITLESEGNKRLFGNNCLYINGSSGDLGHQMILIYKNEDLRSELTGRSREHNLAYSANQCAREIAAVISSGIID